MPTATDNGTVKTPVASGRFDVSGIDSPPRAASAPSLVTAAMKQSKVLMVGDTDHLNGEVLGLAVSPAMLAAAKEGGATHIGLEVDKGLQWRVDQYMSNKIDRGVLEKVIDTMYMGQQNNEDGEFTRQIMSTIDFAKNNNMKIVFADPHNGWGNKPSGLSPEEEKEWNLENSRDRFNDVELVVGLNDILESDENAKIYLVYGNAHFSVDNENKESVNGPFTKISLYSSRADLNSFEDAMQNPDAHGRKMGWMDIKPDLVYFMEEQTFSTTKATSDAVRKAVNDVGTKPTPKQSAETGFTSSSGSYGLDDSKKTILTLETSFNSAASGITPAPDLGREITNPTLKQKAASNATSYLSNGTNGLA